MPLYRLKETKKGKAMGMAASQARFLGLTARKTNVEYEGQQINQQRTTLGNQSANYYSQLLGMAVPTPPSVADFTKTVYSFNDGNLENTITSLIAQGNGNYKVSYLSNWTDDFSIVAAGRTSVVNVNDQGYYVGKDLLKPLAAGLTTADQATNADGENFRLSPSMSYEKDGKVIQLVEADYNKIVSVIGREPQLSDYSLEGLTADYKQTQCYSSVYNDNPNLQQGHIEHNLCKLIWDPNTVGESITSRDGVTLTSNRAMGLTSLCTTWGASDAPDATTKAIKDKLQNYYPDIYQDMIDLYIDLVLYMNENPCGSSGYEVHDCELSDTNYDHNEITPSSLLQRWEDFWSTVENLKPENLYKEAHDKWQAEYDPYVGKYMNTADYSDVYTIEEKLYYDGDDEYLAGLSQDQLERLYDEEAYWEDQLNKIYGTPDNGWYVRYVENSATGEYYPVFYNGDDIADGVKADNGDVHSNVNTYTIGAKERCEEVKSQDARLEQDTTGRFISITLYDNNNVGTTYALTTNTITDQDAYDDAMNQYEYDKYQYEQQIQKINAKISITQAQDKNLELRLKQLDTEQDAIQTEMDAVQSVIEKNTESSFKIFG